MSRRKSAKPRWIRMPLEPTRAMLDGMRGATFLNDGSDLEYYRRYNGLISAVRNTRVADAAKRLRRTR
jgi:hypothetical protein